MSLCTRFAAFAAVFVLSVLPAAAQINDFPYSENFDAVVPPALPVGWSSSQNRTPGVNDFTSIDSSPQSEPNALISTNATIEQSLISPAFSFLDIFPDSLSFFTRRSSTHIAGVLVEVSLDSGETFSLQLGDTLVNPGPAEYFRTVVALPESLSTHAYVVFRWRIIPASSGTTGTFRIDDMNVTARSLDDLAISSIHLTPLFPTSNQVVAAYATVSNVGLRDASQFAAEFFLDVNGDSIGQPSELVATANSVEVVEPGDSTELSANLGTLSIGIHSLIVNIAYPPDQVLPNNVAVKTIAVGYPPNSLVINEIMYAPTGSEPEWIELFNTMADSMNLQQWQISDLSISDKVPLTEHPLYLLPLGYAVLTEDSSSLLDIHPSISAPILNVPTLPSFNNTGDAVVLFDGRGATMDSVHFEAEWGGSDGTSLERVDPLGISQDSTNWKSSVYPGGSSPGLKNSVTQKERDLAVSRILFNPEFPVSGDSVDFTVRVLNQGKLVVSQITVEWYDDVNADSFADPSELLHVVAATASLAPGDSADFSITVPTAKTLDRHFAGKASMESDEDTTNNIRFALLSIGVPSGSVVINEIMYAPSSGSPEWLELFNVSVKTIDIRNWKVGNRQPENRYQLTSESRLLFPGEFLTVTKDSALLRSIYPWLTPESVLQVPALPTFLWNNEGDAVVLSDQRGSLLDTLFYSTLWGGTAGFSLERIDPTAPSTDSLNWGSSVDADRATPGKPNSVVLLDYDLTITALSQLDATGSSVVLSASIVNVGRTSSSLLSISLYHDANSDSIASISERIADTTLVGALAYRETSIVSLGWESPIPGTHTAIAVLEDARDLRSANDTAFGLVQVGFPATALVINEIMYEPLPDQSEYIELYNAGGTDVDVSGWTITDGPGSSGVSNVFELGVSSRIVRPGEYFVIASDSSILDLFPTVVLSAPGLLAIPNSDLSLNNDGDMVMLRDQTGKIIDSLQYLPSWHNPGVHDQTGRSLEKVSPQLNGSDARSWGTCARFEGGTPGERNSIYATSKPGASRLSFSPNPFSPDGDGFEDVVILHYMLPTEVATISVSIYDVMGRLIRRLSTDEPSGAMGDLVWNGYDDENRKARIGMYVVFLEARDARSTSLVTAKGVVVVATRL
jgi:hypothetical protein